jgi:hypothetical protein
MEAVEPIPAYASIFPPGADRRKLAYHFQATYRSHSLESPQLMESLAAEISKWRQEWESCAPKLLVSELSDEQYILFDSRESRENPTIEFIGSDQAVYVLTGCSSRHDTKIQEWALARHYCIEVEGQTVPLGVAEYSLMSGLQAMRIIPQTSACDAVSVATH